MTSFLTSFVVRFCNYIYNITFYFKKLLKIGQKNQKLCLTLYKNKDLIKTVSWHEKLDMSLPEYGLFFDLHFYTHIFISSHSNITLKEYNATPLPSTVFIANIVLISYAIRCITLGNKWFYYWQCIDFWQIPKIESSYWPEVFLKVNCYPARRAVLGYQKKIFTIKVKPVILLY